MRFRRLRPGEVTGPAKLPTPPGLAPNPAGPPSSSTPWAHSPKPRPPPTLSSDPSGAFTPPTLSSEPTRPPTPPTPNHGRTQALLSHRHYQQTHLASPPHLHYRRLRPPDLGAWVRFASIQNLNLPPPPPPPPPPRPSTWPSALTLRPSTAVGAAIPVTHPARKHLRPDRQALEAHIARRLR